MKRKVLSAVIVMLSMCISRTQGGVGIIKNGSFEADGQIADITASPPRNWCDTNIPTAKFGGWVKPGWATHPASDFNSLALYSKANVGFTPGLAATVSQQVYLADVNKIIFDLKLAGTHSFYPWDPAKFSAIILIDGSPVWDSNVLSASAGDVVYRNVEVNNINRTDTDLHTLTLAMRANSTELHQTQFRVFWDFVKFDAHCGGGGYLADDFDRNCHIDLGDFDAIVEQWLVENPPARYDLTEDGFIDSYDFAVFAAEWLDSTAWQNFSEDNNYYLELPDTDLNTDGIIDMADYAIVAGNWGGEGSCLAGDIDHSHTVDYIDLALLANDWLFTNWAYDLE